MIPVTTRTIRRQVLPVYRRARALGHALRRLPEAARRTVPELARDLVMPRGRASVGVFVVSPAAVPALTGSIQAAASAGLQVEVLVLDYAADDAQLDALAEQRFTVRRFWRDAVARGRHEVDGRERPVRTVDFHPRTGRELTHRYLTGDGACWLSVWVDPEDGTPGRAFQHLPATRQYPSLRAAQASWVREVISSMSRPLLIAGDETGEEVLGLVNRIGCTKYAVAGEVTTA